MKKYNLKIMINKIYKQKKRICLVMQGTWVQFLVGGLRFHMLKSN